MHQEFFNEHWLDGSKKPAGGVSTGTGFTISWQNGPLGKAGTEDRKAPNGAFVETLIQAVIERIEFYNSSGFGCKENNEALWHLEQANEWLDKRTKDRQSKGIEGTHELRDSPAPKKTP